jgi:hypothetical protein
LPETFVVVLVPPWTTSSHMRVRLASAILFLGMGCSGFGLLWRGLILSKGARTSAASTPIGPRARL